jgi:hypothetical protein
MGFSFAIIIYFDKKYDKIIIMMNCPIRATSARVSERQHRGQSGVLSRRQVALAVRSLATFLVPRLRGFRFGFDPKTLAVTAAGVLALSFFWAGGRLARRSKEIPSEKASKIRVGKAAGN